jgi:hypothetical protein
MEFLHILGGLIPKHRFKNDKQMKGCHLAVQCTCWDRQESSGGCLSLLRRAAKEQHPVINLWGQQMALIFYSQ